MLLANHKTIMELDSFFYSHLTHRTNTLFYNGGNEKGFIGDEAKDVE